METEISQILVQGALDYFDSMIHEGKVIIDGAEHTFPIWKTRRTDDTLRKYLKLSGEVVGLITKAHLVDNQGRHLYSKTLNFQKEKKGFIIAFPITQKIEVV